MLFEWLAALPVPQSEEVEAKALAAVVQETIFSQLLRLPESEFGVLAYAKITVSLLTCQKGMKLVPAKRELQAYMAVGMAVLVP